MDRVARFSISAILDYFGELALLAKELLICLLTGKLRWRLFLEQIVKSGYQSQLVVLVTGAFTGAVFSAQTFYQLNRIGMESSTGAVVSVAMFRELGPVLSGFMIAGRVGAAMAAEISSMKVSEQIDALRTFAVSPVEYLVAPRALALMICMPVIVAEAVLVGIIAGVFLMSKFYGVSVAWYMHNTKLHTDVSDLWICLLKGLTFGFIIVLVSCHQGFNARYGASDVGRRTTLAVVNSALIILVANFFLTILTNIIWPLG